MPFGFWTESEVGNDDVAFLGEEKFGKGKVDAWMWLGAFGYSLRLFESLPDPPPVMIAVFSSTENEDAIFLCDGQNLKSFWG